jgi:hypothetical protein
MRMVNPLIHGRLGSLARWSASTAGYHPVSRPISRRGPVAAKRRRWHRRRITRSGWPVFGRCTGRRRGQGVPPVPLRGPPVANLSAGTTSATPTATPAPRRWRRRRPCSGPRTASSACWTSPTRSQPSRRPAPHSRRGIHAGRGVGAAVCRARAGRHEPLARRGPRRRGLRTGRRAEQNPALGRLRRDHPLWTIGWQSRRLRNFIVGVQRSRHEHRPR